MYLLKKVNNGVAHYWTGFDTVCKLYSTSSMRKKKYVVSKTSIGRKVCVMCQVNNKKLDKPFVDEEYEKKRRICCSITHVIDCTK